MPRREALNNPGPRGGNIRVDTEAPHLITIAMADSRHWRVATDHPNSALNVNILDYLCLQQHAAKTAYTCKLPGFWPKVLVIRDQPNAGCDLGRQFAFLSDVRIQYYS